MLFGFFMLDCLVLCGCGGMCGLFLFARVLKRAVWSLLLSWISGLLFCLLFLGTFATGKPHRGADILLV